MTTDNHCFGHNSFPFSMIFSKLWWHLDVKTEDCDYNIKVGWLVQERRDSIATALELRLSCTNPWYARFLVEFG